MKTKKLLFVSCFLWITISSKLEANPQARDFPLSSKVQPCDNFYQYVCAAEIGKFEMPANRSRYTFFYADAYENFIRASDDFFNNININASSSVRLKQILDYNSSCKNTVERAIEEKQIVQQTLKEIMILKTRDEILQYLRQQMRQGRFYLFYFFNAPHTEDPKKWRLEIEINALTLPEKSYYQKEEVMKALKEVMELFFTTLSVDEAKEKTSQIMKLESKIAQVTPSPEELDNRWDVADYWNQEEFTKKFPIISSQMDLATVPSQWPIHQYLPHVYETVENILATEDLKTLKVFLLFHLLKNEMDFAYPEFKSALWKFKHQHLGGPAERRKLQEECLVLTQNRLGRSVAKEMTKKLFISFPRKKFIRMVEKVKASFIKGIKQSKWLSPEGHRRALKKVQAVDLALLYPESEKDWRFPPLVDLSEKEFLKNSYKLNHSYDERTFQELKQGRNLKTWSITPLHFDASFYRAENRFYFPAAFAMKPIYDPSLSERKNLAGIGFMIGHELGHALDKFGSLYDETGKKNPIFNDEDQRKFNDFGEKLIQQFDQIGHNGKLTLSENLADHMGLISAFEAAFPKKDSENRQERKDYFIHFARSWCTAITESKRQLHLKEDPHSLPEARVNEQLKHLPAFAETFQCSDNSKMVFPTKKRLRIW